MRKGGGLAEPPKLENIVAYILEIFKRRKST
jgi:hypothetical protein